MSARQRLGRPAELQVLAVGGDLSEVRQEVLRGPEVATGSPGERRAQVRIGTARGQTRIQQRLDVQSLNRTLDLVMIVSRLQGELVRERDPLSPAGVVYETGRVAIRFLGIEFRIAAGERGDLR